jgi:glutaconate CoA-transferase subunit B
MTTASLKMDPEFTPAQIMVTAAAREIADGEVVFVGMRLPLLGFLLAKSTHAPNAIGIYELGIVRNTLAPDAILTMGDLPNFIGGAQVDRFGNLNTSYIGGMQSIQTRLPGSGGACDLASLARRHIIIMAHEKRRFMPRVDYITSPGYGDGARWREQVGLPRGGPSTVITTLGILRFDPDTKEMVLFSIHPGVMVENVLTNTGWPLRVAGQLDQTPVPTRQELAMLKQFDPRGYWTR